MRHIPKFQHKCLCTHVNPTPTCLLQVQVYSTSLSQKRESIVHRSYLVSNILKENLHSDSVCITRGSNSTQ